VIEVDMAEPPRTLSPFACRRRVRALLPAYRDRRRLSVSQLATILGWPPSQVLGHESSGVLDDAEAEVLIAHYELAAEAAATFRMAVDGARRPEWWSPFESSLDSGSRHLLAHEAAARTIRHYDTHIPALLQTAARYRIAPSLPLLPGASNENAEQIHAGRRRLVTSSGHPHLHAVLDEAALWHAIGGLDVHLDQLDHLTGLFDARQVRISVLPLARGAHRASSTPSLTLYDLPPALPGSAGSDVVRGHVNALNIPVVRAEPGWVRDGEALFRAACDTSLGPDGSYKAILHARAELAGGRGYTPCPET
jgi:hypothetical protein